MVPAKPSVGCLFSSIQELKTSLNDIFLGKPWVFCVETVDGKKSWSSWYGKYVDYPMKGDPNHLQPAGMILQVRTSTVYLEWPAFVSVVWGGKDGKYHHHHSTANDHLHYDHRFGWFSSRFKIHLDRGAITMKDTHKDFKKRLVEVLWFSVCEFHPMVVWLCCCHRHARKTMGIKGPLLLRNFWL